MFSFVYVSNLLVLWVLVCYFRAFYCFDQYLVVLFARVLSVLVPMVVGYVRVRFVFGFVFVGSVYTCCWFVVSARDRLLFHVFCLMVL